MATVINSNFDTEYKSTNPHNDVGILVDRNRALAGGPAFFINTTDGKRVYGESPEEVINKFENNPVGEKKKNSDDIGVGVLIDRKHKRKGHLYFIELKSGCRVYADSVINVVKALHNINDKTCKKTSRPSTPLRPSKLFSTGLVSLAAHKFRKSALTPPPLPTPPPSSSTSTPLSPTSSSTSKPCETAKGFESPKCICASIPNVIIRQECLEAKKQEKLKKARLTVKRGGSRTKTHRKKSRSSSRKKFKR